MNTARYYVEQQKWNRLLNIPHEECEKIKTRFQKERGSKHLKRKENKFLKEHNKMMGRG